MKLTARLAAASALAAVFLTAGCSQEKVCAADEQNVGGTCYALQSDRNNCGSRGNVCGAGQGCSAGVCVDCASASGACTSDVVAACFNLNQVRPLGAALAPSDVPLGTDSGPIAFARLGDALFVANSTSSSISRVTLSPPAATSGASSIKVPNGGASFADLEHIAARNGLLWVSNASANTLVALDPASGTAVDEIPLATSADAFGVFAQGFDFVGTKAYVALNGVNAIAVLDVSTVPGKVTKRIELAPLASPGTSAGPTRVVAIGSRVYVTLNNMFDASFVPVPGAYGRLAVIDADADAVVGGAIDLGAGCLNAGGLASSGTTLWVGCGFFDLFGTKAVSGGALVPVDLASGAPVVGAPIPLTHAATAVTLCEGRGYAGASESGTVISFDPVARAVTGSALVCPAAPDKASYVPAVACAR